MNVRDKYIAEIHNKANELVKDYTWNENCKLWEMVSCWNDSHDVTEEIFMCEIEADEEHENGGFMIEDYSYYF